jgi:undecaprenyl-diphosphatase
VGWDRALFHWINGLAGHVPLLDYILIGIASDYFIIVIMCLVLVVMWFGTPEQHLRRENQLAVVAAMSSLGLASAIMGLILVFFVWNNVLEGTALANLFNRPRPFEVESGVNLLFYRPTDPSFPSNMAAVVFGLAIAVWLKNKKVGSLLLGMACLVGFARIYVGIHYPGDILGGAFVGLLGVAWAFALIKILWPVKRLLFWVLEKLYLAG